MKPSETQAGRAWLANFSGPEKPVATVLIDALRYVSLSTLWQGLKRRLDVLASAGVVDFPALVLPERNLREFSIAPERRDSAVAYQDFDPGADLGISPGSAALVAMIVRDLNRGDLDGTRWLPPNASIDELRMRQCRSIVVATDLLGSGRQVTTFVEALARNRRIRSWRSFGWIKIYVVAFAASNESLIRLAKSSFVDNAWATEGVPTFGSMPWSPTVADGIRDLCRTKCLLRDQWAFGYGGSAGMLVTERGAPNNLPAVFWQEARGWLPLFPRRAVPSTFASELSDYRAAEPLPDLAERIGQLRLGRNDRVRNFRPRSQRILEALILTQQRVRTITELATELAIDISDAENLLTSMQHLGFIDAQRSITEMGRREIITNKRGLRRTTASLAGSEEPYYPWSLK